MWLDKSELRGGDAWDAQIKKHIHDCALFIPVISAQTNARTEGYFRREWKLATRRLLDISDDAAFLVPVVIDETREAEARVPEEFLHAQWTRLPGGATPPEFAQRVRQLLGTDIAAAHTAQSAALAKSEPSTRVGYGRRNRRTPPVRLVGIHTHCAPGSGRRRLLVFPTRERRACGEVDNDDAITCCSAPREVNCGAAVR